MSIFKQLAFIRSGHRLLVPVFLTATLLAACQRERSEVEFCPVGEEELGPRPSLAIDIRDRRIMGVDTSARIEIIETRGAKGFVMPFPLSLPSQELLASPNLNTWELGGFVFTATPLPSADSTWTLIHGRLLNADADHIADESSVLYSTREGVLAIRLLTRAEGRVIASEWLACGSGSLKESDF